MKITHNPRVMSFCLLLALALNASAAPKEKEEAVAEPQNIFVEGLTFTRPAHWKWLPSTEGSTTLARFEIRERKDSKRPTDVRFYVTDRKPEETKSFWKSFFVKDQQTSTEEKITLGKYEVTYFAITGTHRAGKNKLTPNCKFVGTIIPVGGEKFVLARLFGPAPEVDAAMKDYRLMVQSALD